MVATVSALSSAGQAASYYEADDYYADGGLSPSEWFGAGADALGLKGEVDRDTFRSLLEGQVAGGQLGTTRDGKIEHRPGWDVTFSAPKSVSVMALVAGDKRVISAHAAAVKVALAHVERHMAATRVRDGGAVAREATGNLAVATFRHETSRAQDPQLHSHAVILNATQDRDGTWRSLEPRALYQLQKQIGAIYRQELARGVASLGYAIERGKHSTFEIVGVPEPVIDALSQRTAAIDARLAERGTSREQASAAEKQIAALDTRDAKQHADHRALRKEWRATADAQGFDQAARKALVAGARGNVLGADQLTEAAFAQRAVAFATAKLSEREAVFAEATLAKEAGDYSFGRVGHAAIVNAIDVAREAGALVPRIFLDKRGAEFAGFTTPQAIETERTMLRIEAAGRGTATPLANRMTAASIVERAALASGRSGHVWTDDQKRATAELLSSQDRVAGVQGYAGTAKTTTVLATYAREAARQGYAVTALAPTASAALVLGEALGTRGDTVARHVIAPASAGNKAVWVVDEASMLSAHDTARLLTAAEKTGARVVLVGDVKQLGSVGAGAAFAQLQAAGMATARLAEIVRQTNAKTREAVFASIDGDMGKAFAALDRGGGRVIEAATVDTRLDLIAREYVELSPAKRERTLVIEPSREGRERLTAHIRERLIERGELSQVSLSFDRLEAKSLTRAEAREASSYQVGDFVKFARDYPAKGAERGEAFRVALVNSDRNVIELAGRDGQTVIWHPRQWGAGKSEAFTPVAMELRTGDRLQFTRNDRAAGRTNGLQAVVLAIDPLKSEARIKSGPRVETLKVGEPRDHHVRHGYVQTAYGAQGRTADWVVIHLDSKATNLADQRAFYVAVSRAREAVTIVTDNRVSLTSAVSERAGERQSALPQVKRDAGAGLG